MSLAHLRVVKAVRDRTAAGAAAARKPTSASTAYCGASHEPVYRTVDEATASGLEVCDSCVLLLRHRPKSA